MITALIITDLILCLILIGLVLIQHGKGADMGSGFGAGAAGGMVESVSPANLLNKLTALVAALFFIVSLSLTWGYQQQIGSNEIIEVDPIEIPEALQDDSSLLNPNTDTEQDTGLEPQ